MIDVLAGETHFVHHLAPVWKALPPGARGDFVVYRSRHAVRGTDPIAAAKARGIEGVPESSDPKRPVLVCSWGDHRTARAQGRKRIARMEHGIGQSFIGSTAPSYAGGEGCEDVSLWLTPNEYSAAKWRAAYPKARVEVIGCPKLDTLPHRGPGVRPTVAVSFHWGIGKPRGNDPLLESYGSWPEYREAVARLAQTYRVIGHGHPRMLPYLARYYRRFGIEVVEDFADVCRKADVYVCDTNSTIYEFASTGRPVVVVNGSHFRREVEHGLRFWEAASVGVNCDHPTALKAAVAQALAEDRTAAREAALDIVYAYRTGAAQRAATALVGAFTAARKAA